MTASMRIPPHSREELTRRGPITVVFGIRVAQYKLATLRMSSFARVGTDARSSESLDDRGVIASLSP